MTEIVVRLTVRAGAYDEKTVNRLTDSVKEKIAQAIQAQTGEAPEVTTNIVWDYIEGIEHQQHNYGGFTTVIFSEEALDLGQVLEAMTQAPYQGSQLTVILLNSVGVTKSKSTVQGYNP